MNDWEIDEMARLLSLLDLIILNQEGEDYRRWNAANNGIFNLRSCYGMLEDWEGSSFDYISFGV